MSITIHEGLRRCLQIECFVVKLSRCQMWPVMCVRLYRQHVMADRLNHVYTSSFQLDCLTRVRPPTKAVRIRRLWSICIDASDSWFCPPSPASDRETQEAVTAAKVALSILTPASAWSLSCPKFPVKAGVNKTMYPVPVIGLGLSFSVKR